MGLDQSRVLIVEDNAIIAHDLAEELESRGAHRVDVAGTIEAALAAIAKGVPEIAILDWRLAGGETSEQLSCALARSGVRVCILSGHDSPERAALEVPHTFIEKPTPAFIIADLVERYAAMDQPPAGSVLQ